MGFFIRYWGEELTNRGVNNLNMIITNETIVWLLVATFPFSVLACLFGLKKGWWFNLSMVVVYIVVYGVLSANGQYISGNHGGNDNREIWYAKCCGTQIMKNSGRIGSEPTFLGVFFWPAAIIDRVLIHKDIDDN